MKALDRILRRWRITKAAKHIPPGARLLDIGCWDGALFRFLGPRISSGLGIDSLAPGFAPGSPFEFVRGRFPADMPDREPFDAITALAVLEHQRPEELPGFCEGCARFLIPGGLLILTVPSPMVDRILDVLLLLRLADGISLEEHYGFSPSITESVFSAGPFALRRHERFQLGLNNLFVLERIP